MALKPFDYLLQHLRLRVTPPSGEDTTDGQMLQRFLLQREEAAFAALMQRHGPMVLGICRRLLDEPADVEDAFQATFLVLVHRAESVRKRESVGSFLHGVALRVAHRIRTHAQQRRIHERQAFLPRATPPDPIVWRDLRPVLDEELDRLPEKYRAPLVLCYLEGKTHEEAARQLGWTNGTVCGRLARARDLLRGRLVRRGLTLSAATLPVLLTENALPAAVPGALSGGTLQAVLFHSGLTGAGVLPARIIVLAEETARSLFLSKINAAVVLTLTLVLLAGAGVVIEQTLRAKVEPPPPAGPLPEQAADKPRVGGPLDAPLPNGAIARLGRTRFRHGAHVAALAFSPDGKTLAAISDDSSVILWDAATGEATADFVPHPAQRVGLWAPYRGALAFSLDGESLAIGWDNSQVGATTAWWAGITQWDRVGQKQRYLLPLQGPHSVRTIAFSPDKEHWAAADDGGGVFLWDGAGPGQETKLDVPDHVSYSVVFSTDGKDLILATRADRRTFGRPGRGEVLFWDVATRKVHRAFFVDQRAFVESMSLSADGKTLAVLAGSKASLWNLTRREMIRPLKTGADVCYLAFSPDGKTIALGCWGPADRNPDLGTVSLLDTDTGEERLVLKGLAKCLAFSPDGQVLATGRSDCTVRLWDTRTGNPIAPPAGHTDAITQVAASRDGKTIVSTGEDGTACVWDAATAALVLNQKFPAGFGAVRVTPDGQVLATRDSTPFGRPGLPSPILWDVRTAKELLAMEAVASGGAVCPVAVSPDGQTVATGIEDTVALWNVAIREERIRLRGCEGAVDALCFTDDGAALATHETSNLKDGQVRPPCIRLWDVKTGQQLHKIAVERMGAPFVLSHDARRCATCHGSEVAVWDIPLGRKLRTLESPGPLVRSLALAEDGKTLLAGDTQGTINVWDLQTGTRTRKLTGHRGAVTALAFLGKNRVVSGSSDTTLLIWDLNPPPTTLGAGPGAPFPCNNDFRLVNSVPMPETNNIQWRTGCLLHTCPDGSNWTAVRIECPCLLPPAPVVRIKS